MGEKTMSKQNLLKFAALIMTLCCLFVFVACGSESENISTKETTYQTNTDTTASIDTEPDTATDKQTDAETTAVDPGTDAIAKINGGADEVGIYSVVIRLTDKAADKGVVEMVYHGAKDSPQKNSVVNTFRIEYFKESDGKFTIHTFFDGEVYQNLNHKDEVKVTNTFGATLRAGDVIISYTPEGGETQEIFRADSDYFFVPTN